jgi:hypothetical protein
MIVGDFDLIATFLPSETKENREMLRNASL